MPSVLSECLGLRTTMQIVYNYNNSIGNQVAIYWVTGIYTMVALNGKMILVTCGIIPNVL